MRPLTHTQSEQLLDEQGIKDNTTRQQILFLASGLYAEMKRMANDNEYLKLRGEQVKRSKDLLTGATYQRLRVVQEFSNDRSAALQLLQDCLLLLSKNTISDQERVIKRIDTIVDVYEKVLANGNIRLQLARVCYN